MIAHGANEPFDRAVGFLMRIDMEELSAYHESGHALMAIYVGAKVLRVTIEPEWDDGPLRHADIQIEWPHGIYSDKELYEKTVQVALAGPAAEMIHTGDPYHPGLVAEWAADWNVAWEAAAHLIRNERRRLIYLEQVSRQMYQLLQQDRHWAALAAVVDNLLAHETLEGEDLEDIVRQWID